MTIFWQERVRAAELVEFEATPVGRILAAIGLSGHWIRRAHLAKRVDGLARLGARLPQARGSSQAVSRPPALLMVVGVVALIVLAIAQLV